jgi:hypothetical protein
VTDEPNKETCRFYLLNPFTHLQMFLGLRKQHHNVIQKTLATKKHLAFQQGAFCVIKVVGANGVEPLTYAL